MEKNAQFREKFFGLQSMLTDEALEIARSRAKENDGDDEDKDNERDDDLHAQAVSRAARTVCAPVCTGPHLRRAVQWGHKIDELGAEMEAALESAEKEIGEEVAQIKNKVMEFGRDGRRKRTQKAGAVHVRTRASCKLSRAAGRRCRR